MPAGQWDLVIELTRQGEQQFRSGNRVVLEVKAPRRKARTMAETLDLSMFVEPGDAGTSRMTLAVEGVSCAGCIRKIETGLPSCPASSTRG